MPQYAQTWVRDEFDRPFFESEADDGIGQLTWGVGDSEPTKTPVKPKQSADAAVYAAYLENEENRKLSARQLAKKIGFSHVAVTKTRAFKAMRDLSEEHKRARQEVLKNV